MKNKFSIFALITVLLVIGQVPDSEQFEWSWTSFRNRITDAFRSSLTTTTARPSLNIPTTPRTRATTWRTTTQANYASVTTRRTATQDQSGSGSTSRTCACGDETASVCASNGVTYKNRCKFDCAKSRVTRLRIVSNGACGTMGVDKYWGASSRRN